MKKIEKSAGELFESPLLIKSSPNCSLEKLEFFIEEMIKENPLELVIIDSLDYIRELAFADKNQLLFVTFFVFFAVFIQPVIKA